MKQMTACQLINWRKDLPDHVNLTLLKPQVDVKTMPHDTSTFFSDCFCQGGREPHESKTHQD